MNCYDVGQNKNIAEFLTVCRENGIDCYEYNLMIQRVLMTKKALEGKTGTVKDTFVVMQKETSGMYPFQRNAEVWEKIYVSLKDANLGDLYDLIGYAAYSARDHLVVPDSLVDLFEMYITDNVKTVFVPDCEIYNKGLAEMISFYSDVQFILGTKVHSRYELLTLLFKAYDNVEVIIADIYRDGFTDKRYDLILAVPVVGARNVEGNQGFISNDLGQIALQNLLYHIELTEGKLVIVLPQKISFAGGNVAALRAYIQSNYKLEEISILPAGIFYPITGALFQLYMLKNGETDEIVARKYISPKPIRRDEFCEELVRDKEELVFPDEFETMHGWNINMILEPEDEDLMTYARANMKKATLSEVATVFRGKAVNMKSDKGNIKVINISNLSDAGIDYENLDLLEEDELKASRYALETGDVLVTARGTTVKVAVFEDQDKTCIPSANLIVVRPGKTIRGMYLKLFLDTPVGTKLLQSLQRGTTVMNINYLDLKTLEIPVIPLDEQDALIKEYEEGLIRYLRTVAEATEAWTKVRKSIRERLY